ncbi:MAG: hypothetical protein LBI45_03595 [Bacteroidales bacterium]|jgi:hypothetical protein|nr:hypothetical protein [Bacteroidales bacterium]
MEKLTINKNITEIDFQEEWRDMNLVIYAEGLGKVRDLIALLPVIKRLNLKFFLDGAKKENYDAVQILSSLGVYSGIVINEKADWEKLTDLMYYALCGRIPHAPIEPFQYVYDSYEKNVLVDYSTVFFNNSDRFFTVRDNFNEKDVTESQRKQQVFRQKFFYQATPCSSCAGWRICMGKYAVLEDKTGCQAFTNELLTVIENLKFKK